MSFLGGWKTASFLVASESNVRHWGPLPAGPVRASGPCCFAVARAPFVSFLGGGWKTATERLGPSLRALLVRCGEGAVCEPSLAAGRQLAVFFAVARAPFVSLVGGWKTASCFAVARAPFVSLVGGWKTASFLVGSESNVRDWGPLPAGPVRPSGPCCFAVARASFVSFLGGWKTASFLVGSESNVRHWGPLPAGPVRASEPCCFAVARAPFVRRQLPQGSVRPSGRCWFAVARAPFVGEGAVCEPCWRLEDS